LRLQTRVRYYSSRVLERLEAAGVPLRRRSLLFFARSIHPGDKPGDAAGIVRVEAITPERLRRLVWPGNPKVLDEAATWQGAGVRRPIAALRGNILDGFCWLEERVAELRFFDLEAPLPPATGYLSRVWVHPSARGSGIGGALIENAMQLAAEAGIDYIVSACVPLNHRMQHLYSRLGWSVSQRVDYLRVGPLLCFAVRPVGWPPTRVYTRERAAPLIFTPPAVHFAHGDNDVQ